MHSCLFDLFPPIVKAKEDAYRLIHDLKINVNTGTSFYKPKFSTCGQIPVHLGYKISEIKIVTENERLKLSSKSMWGPWMKDAIDSKCNYFFFWTQTLQCYWGGYFWSSNFQCFKFFRRCLRISYFWFSKEGRKTAFTQITTLCVKTTSLMSGLQKIERSHAGC